MRCRNTYGIAIMLALLHRLRSGQGQMVGASLAQAATFLQVPSMLAYRGKEWDVEPGGQNCCGYTATRRLFCAADRWFYAAARSMADFRRIEGLSEGGDLEDQFAQAAVEVWVERLLEAGIGAHPLRTPHDVMADPRAISHGLSREVDFPEVGPGQVMGPAPRPSRTPMVFPFADPPPGWHTNEILFALRV
jgi:crotonobetainyl-CoA:carnitine CoA-transferase CaiB-like acyl-CoA transferase